MPDDNLESILSFTRKVRIHNILFYLQLTNGPNKLVFPALSNVCQHGRSIPGALPLHCRIGSWPYLQTLDKAGKVCQGQTLLFIAPICKIRRK